MKNLLFLTVILCSSLCNSQALITIDFTGSSVNPALFGTNLQWEDSGDGIYSNEINHFNSYTIENINHLGLTSIRFPGGALSDSYDWKNGIGNPSNRLPGLAFDKSEKPSHFGTDELLKLCDKTGIKPVITVNFNLSPEYAVEWIDYIYNFVQDNKINSACFPEYVEIGNEVYNPSEEGFTTAENYILRANEFASLIKQSYPEIKIGAVAEASFLQAAWMPSVYPHMATWNADVIKDASTDIDFLVLHFYAPYDKDPNDKTLTKLVLAGPDVFIQNVESIEGLLNSYNKENIKLAVTEYNTFFGDVINLDPRTAKPESALFNALMIIKMVNKDNIIFANHWSLINNNVFGLLKKENGIIESRPSADVFEVLSNQAGNSVIKHKIHSEIYSVDAKGNIPNIQVSFIDSLITVNSEGEFILNIVNKDEDNSYIISIDGINISGFEVTMTQWHGKILQDWNASEKIEESLVIDGDFIEVPPFSFTSIKF